jgi:hypothetical protein
MGGEFGYRFCSVGIAKMFKRSPQKSPQFTILNLQSGVLIADRPDALARVPKSFCRVLKYSSGDPRKYRDNPIYVFKVLRAIGGGS